MSYAAPFPHLATRQLSTSELLADAVVHALAIVAGLIAFPLLLGHAIHTTGVSGFLALAVYAACFFLMWGFSLAYNMAPPSPLKWLLRRFDHSAIYLMIAGSYTAVLSQLDSFAWALGVGVFVWVVAGVGMAIKLAMPGRFDRASLVAYVALGWLGIVAIGPLSLALPVLSLWLLLAGGATYVAGILFHLWSGLRFQNALWHLFVAVAAGLHFAAITVAVVA